MTRPRGARPVLIGPGWYRPAVTSPRRIEPWLILALASLCSVGCESLTGTARRDDRSARRSRLDVVFASRCPHPIDICYGRDTCLTLPAGGSRRVRAETWGNEVVVNLKGSMRSISADETFGLIEVDEACVRLDRRLTPRTEPTSATAGGPSQ